MSSLEKIVLVVEDEWLVRMELSLTFQNAGWEVLEASTGEEGERIFVENPAIALLLTDIRLNGSMSGWDLAEVARRNRQDVAVIYVSANPTRSERQVERSAFIQKPAFMEEILEATDNLLSASE